MRGLGTGVKGASNSSVCHSSTNVYGQKLSVGLVPSRKSADGVVQPEIRLHKSILPSHLNRKCEQTQIIQHDKQLLTPGTVQPGTGSAPATGAGPE